MAAKEEQRLSNGVVTLIMYSASNVKYNRVSLICVLYRILLFLEDLSTIVLLYLVFMCCAGYERCEGRLERHWEGAMAVFMAYF
jgi:hypothetical protein